MSKRRWAFGSLGTGAALAAALALGSSSASAQTLTRATYLGSNLGYVSPSASLASGSSHNLFNSYTYGGGGFASFNPFAGLGANGTSGTGTNLSTSVFSLAFLLGAHMDASLENGLPVQLRIAGLRPKTLLLWALDIEVSSATGPTQSLCPEGAYLLPRRVSAMTGLPEEGGGFDFACVGSSVGKCIEYGYSPWVPSQTETHQACVRMLRADYCGDGRSFTVDGTLIGVNDPSGVQQDAGSSLEREAVWGPDGALCVERTRSADADDSCITALRRRSCEGVEGLLVSSVVVEQSSPHGSETPEVDETTETVDETPTARKKKKRERRRRRR